MKMRLPHLLTTVALTYAKKCNRLTHMKKIVKLLVAGMLAGFCCSVGHAQSYSNALSGGTLIYSNAFNGDAVSLNGSAPTIANSVLGGTNSAVWNGALSNDAGSVLQNGNDTSSAGDSWGLPFKPQPGYVYTLSASFTFFGNPGNWIGFGFAQNDSSNLATGGRYADSATGDPNGYDFMIANESSGNVQFFGGPHATATVYNQNGAFGPGAGTYSFSIILDTTPTKWAVALFGNGVQKGTNFTYTTNPNIGATGLTQNAPGSPANAHWNSFSLTATPLVIMKQPVSAGVATGATFTNSIVVAAASPSYQWYQDGQPLPRAGQTNLVNGATNATLIFSSVQPADASTNYYVVVSNSLGSVTSAPATLAVYSAPIISQAFPVTYTNVMTLYGGTTVSGTNYSGSSPSFSVTAIGVAPLYYQWLTNGVPVSGATNTSFKFVNCPLNGPTNFSCVVSNVGGSATYTWPVSYIATPAVLFPSTVLSYQPVGFWRLNEGPDNSGGDDGFVAIDYASGNDGMYTNAIIGNTYTYGIDPSSTSVLFASYASPDSDVFGIQGIDFAKPTNSSATFSVQAWVNGIGSQGSGAGIISKGYNGGEEFSLNITNNKYSFLVRDVAGNPYSVTSATGPDGGWHFLVGVCDEVNGAVSLYVDGVPAGSVGIPAGVGLLSSTSEIVIGARSSSATSDNNLQFQGYMDDVAAFNYALTLDQIDTEYSTVASVPPYFVQQPPASITLNAGAPLNLPAIAAGSTPVGYYWTDVNAGTNVAAGSTNKVPLNAGLTVSSVPGSWNGDQLELTVTNAAGSTNVFVSLTVFTNLEIVNDLPATISLLPGASYTYSIGIVGPGPYLYQWYHAGSPVANQTNATYTVTAPSGSTTYSVVVSNAFSSVNSSVSTVTTITQLTNAYASGVLQLNASGYWPMHEAEAALPGDIETNYGTLGVLGTAYYSDWVQDYGAFTRQQPGAIAGGDTALHFNYNVGNLANGAGTWTNEIYVPHTSPLSTLNPPFSVECWLYNTNTSVGQVNQSVWGQHGWEGFNAGNAGSGTGGATISGMQLAFSTGGLTVYGYFGGVQNPIISAPASINTWVHVVVTCDANTNFTLYVDGTAQANGAGVGKYSPDYWTPLTIGGTRGGTRSAIVTVDEFAVYTNLISDISTHYNDASVSDSAYFHDVTNDNPVIYLRMDAPAYTAPNTGSWPELVNYGTVGNPGVYTPGTMLNAAPSPITTNNARFVGLSGTNVSALSGVSSFADAGYASAYNPTGSNANFSVSALFRGNPCDNRVESIVSHGTNSWQLNITTNGTIAFNAGNGGSASSGTGDFPGDIKTRGVYNDGKWHHVVAINRTNVVSIYVDGVLDTNGTPPGITPTSMIPGNSAHVMIGADPSFTNNPVGVGRQFAGQVCEVSFFNQGLTAQQVQTLYKLAVTGSAVNTNPTNIVASVVGNQLLLSWPSDHTGWTLQAQTNNLSTGLGGNWVDVPNSASTNQVLTPINPANGSVFYRLRYQP